MSIFEMMEYGPIMACNEEYGLVVTVNGTYLNLWANDGSGGNWQNTDCRALNAENGLHGLEITKVMDMAEQYLKDVIAESLED